MKKFEVSEHTADLKIRVFGKTKEELFLNAMLGIIDALQAGVKTPAVSNLDDRQNLKQKVKVQSTNLEIQRTSHVQTPHK